MVWIFWKQSLKPNGGKSENSTYLAGEDGEIRRAASVDPGSAGHSWTRVCRRAGRTVSSCTRNRSPQFDETGKIGVVRTTHGGTISSQNKYEQSLGARFTQNIPEKHQLARLAVELIPPGSTLFVDFGTTTNLFAEHIKELSDLTVFTNSHLIAATLSENSTC